MRALFTSGFVTSNRGAFRRSGVKFDEDKIDRIELFYEDSPEATIRATVNRLTKSDLTVIAAHHRKDRSEV